MWKLPLLFIVLPLIAYATPDNNNVQMTRTSIKVARNLDPDAMETLQVKTRTGDVATIVVKKRDGRLQQFAESTPKPVAAAELQLISTSGHDDNSSPRVPEPVVIRSDSVYVKNQKEDEEEKKKSRSLFHVDSDGIPVITGVREPDDANDTQVWRNARVINGILVPNRVQDQQVAKDQHVAKLSADRNNKPAAVAPMFNGVWQVYRKKPEPTAEQQQQQQQQQQVFTAQRDSYDEKYMTDKILGYIRNINGNVLQRQQGNDELRRTSRRVMFDDQDDEPPRMEARVLHAPSVSVFPNSAAYSPKTVSRLSFEESARTPVLQYAHPELGVQAAKYEPVQKQVAVQQLVPAQQQVGAADETMQRDGRRQQALLYFGHDIHADRSPYAFEPGLEKESRVKVPKKFAPHYNGGLPEKQGKYYGQPTYNYANGDDSSSFWAVVKNKMRTSFDQMSDLTRPVVDPLVEATHKITGNLGFGTGNRELTNVVKEKLGMVATPSILLPALGLVAGGAALGLGAVAVGRYLDYDVVRMRNNDDIIEYQRSLNGSYQPILIQSEQQENRAVKKTENEGEPLKRNRRSLHYNKKERPYTANRKIRKVKLTLNTQ